MTDSGSPEGVAPRWIAMAGAAVDVLCEAVILVCAAVVVTFEYGRDQAAFAVIGREMLRGAVPYRDLFEVKTPGILFVYAAAHALFGPAHWGIRVIEALSMLASAAGLVILSRRYLGSTRIGLAAAALSCLIHVQQDFWYTAQPENFCAPVVVWGFLFASGGDRATGRRSAAAWFVSGVLFGIAGLLRPTVAFIGPVLAVMSVAKARRISPVVTMCLGGLAPVAVTVVWFRARGGLGALYETLFVWAPHYTRLGWQGQAFIRGALLAVPDWLTLHSDLIGLGVALLLVFRPPREAMPLVVALLAAIAVQIGGVILQAKFFAYHWAGTFPLSALLAATGLGMAAKAAGRRGPAAMAAFAATVALVGAMPLRPETRHYEKELWRKLALRVDLLTGRADPALGMMALAVSQDGDTRPAQVTGAFLAEHLPPRASVFVFGFEPLIYDLTDRPLVSRYIYDTPQRVDWSAEEARATLMRELEAHLPGAIVVEHGDYMPWVVGNNEDSAGTLERFPALERLLVREYALGRQIGNLDIYLRRSG